MLKQKELLEKYCGQFNSTLSLILNADYGFRFVKHRVEVDNTKRMLQWKDTKQKVVLCECSFLVKKMRRKTDQNKGKLYFERQPGKAEDQKGGDTGDWFPLRRSERFNEKINICRQDSQQSSCKHLSSSFLGLFFLKITLYFPHYTMILYIKSKQELRQLERLWKNELED